MADSSLQSDAGRFRHTVPVFQGQAKLQISCFLEELPHWQAPGVGMDVEQGGSRQDTEARVKLGREARRQAGQGGTVWGRQGEQGKDGHFQRSLLFAQGALKVQDEATAGCDISVALGGRGCVWFLLMQDEGRVKRWQQEHC